MVCVCDRPCADQGLLPVRSPPLNFTEAELLDGRVYCVSLSLYLKRQRGIGSFFFSFFFFYYYFFARVILVRKNRAQEKKKKTSKGRGGRRRGKVLSHSAVTQRWWTFFFFFFFLKHPRNTGQSREREAVICAEADYFYLFILFTTRLTDDWRVASFFFIVSGNIAKKRKISVCVCVCVCFFSHERGAIPPCFVLNLIHLVCIFSH